LRFVGLDLNLHLPTHGSPGISNSRTRVLSISHDDELSAVSLVSFPELMGHLTRLSVEPIRLVIIYKSRGPLIDRSFGNGFHLGGSQSVWVGEVKALVALGYILALLGGWRGT
jgi:hypothetical protein